MGALAGDSPCLGPWRWHRAHLHREEAGLDIPCEPWLTTRGQFGTQASPESEAGGEKGKGEPCPAIINLHKTRSQTPLLPPPCKGKKATREKGRINTLLAACSTHRQGAPVLGCLGCSEKHSMCIIPGTGRWAPSAGADQDHQAQLSPSPKHQPFPHCFTSREAAAQPRVWDQRCPGAGPQLASPVTVPLRHLLAAAFAFPPLQQLLQ